MVKLVKQSNEWKSYMCTVKVVVKTMSFANFVKFSLSALELYQK